AVPHLGYCAGMERSSRLLEGGRLGSGGRAGGVVATRPLLTRAPLAVGAPRAQLPGRGAAPPALGAGVEQGPAGTLRVLRGQVADAQEPWLRAGNGPGRRQRHDFHHVLETRDQPALADPVTDPAPLFGDGFARRQDHGVGQAAALVFSKSVEWSAAHGVVPFP